MDSLVIQSRDGATATFHSRVYDQGGRIDSYGVDLRAPGFTVSTTVANPGYGHPPTQLFDELASQWRGWRGTKGWLSLEGELEIQATADAVGHITITFKVPAYSAHSKWSSLFAVVVDAGQLEVLAADAAVFFEHRAA